MLKRILSLCQTTIKLSQTATKGKHGIYGLSWALGPEKKFNFTVAFRFGIAYIIEPC